MSVLKNFVPAIAFCLVRLTLASAQVVHLPSVPRPAGAEQIVGANFQNPTTSTLPAHTVQLGQALRQGDLPANSGIAAAINGTAAPAQIDIKTKYPDGSARFGVITVMAPMLAPGSANPTMFSKASGGSAPISLATMPNYGFTVTIAFIKGAAGSFEFDAAQLLPQALAAGRVSYWRQGPIVTEGRIEVPVAASMRLVFAISKNQDGTYSTEVQFNNDLAMTAVGGTLTYTASVRQDGTIVYQSPPLTHFQYQQWHKAFWTRSSPAVNVQRDIGYLEKTGAIQHYDLTTGVNESILKNYAATMTTGDWTAPFGSRYDSGYTFTNGVTMGMGITGGRADIGPETAYNTTWLMTQHATAAKMALFQAETAANIPWHMWDACHDAWLNTDNYPKLWSDYRGRNGRPCDPNSGGLTQAARSGPLDGCCSVANGWQPDPAHQPELSYVPYLMTGGRFYLDQLNAVVSFDEMSNWPTGAEGDGRYAGQGLIVTGNSQVRGAAWALRGIVAASYANPDGSSDKAYATKMQDNNLRYLVSHMGAWQAAQGESYGWLHDISRPWMNDMFATSLVMAARLGDSRALTYLIWANNYYSGRFLNAAKGFNPHDGTIYSMGDEGINGRNFPDSMKTWAGLEAGIKAANLSAGDGWSGYEPIAAAAVAGIIDVTGSADAKRAYAWLRSADAAGLGAAAFQADPTFNIVPGAPVR
ncbi:MAG: hypothetical protein ABSA58_09525 [Acetobacteraceae bacterium]